MAASIQWLQLKLNLDRARVTGHFPIQAAAVNAVKHLRKSVILGTLSAQKYPVLVKANTLAGLAISMAYDPAEASRI